MARAHLTPMCVLAMLLTACASPQGTPPATSGTGTTSTTSGDGSLGTSADASRGGEASGSASTSDGADATGPAQPLPCNGHPALCSRRFDEVVFAGTHNSHSARDAGFPAVNANQEHDIARQLEDGIRVLLIDIYPDEADPDTVVMCHGPCTLASTPHLEGLAAITTFLQANPREVVTIIYEDHVGVPEIEQDFASSGAETLVYAHAPGEPWPTLGEMIDADTRLVVTAESGGPPPAWLHHVWDEAWDTPYGPATVEALSCALNRGSSDNDLFLVNHWVNDAFGLPSQRNAAVVNASEILQARAEECRDQWDHAPNFLVVDFYEQGELFAVVAALNGVSG